MKPLNEEQLVFVEKMLDENKVTYDPLKEELLDHICCVIEMEMEKGKPFEMAFVHAQSQFGGESLQKIQKETIHQLTFKQKLMKRITVFAGALTMGMLFLAITALAQNTPDLFPIKNGKINERATYGAKDLKIKGKVVTKFHTGIDIIAPKGTPILATADGVVELAELEKPDKSGYGTNIILKHDENFKTRYGHLEKMAVKTGDEVKKGEVIGYCGNTGRSSGTHLHYEIIKDGEKVDPEKFFTKK